MLLSTPESDSQQECQINIQRSCFKYMLIVLIIVIQYNILALANLIWESYQDKKGQVWRDRLSKNCLWLDCHGVVKSGTLRWDRHKTKGKLQESTRHNQWRYRRMCLRQRWRTRRCSHCGVCCEKTNSKKQVWRLQTIMPSQWRRKAPTGEWVSKQFITWWAICSIFCFEKVCVKMFCHNRCLPSPYQILFTCRKDSCWTLAGTKWASKNIFVLETQPTNLDY